MTTTGGPAWRQTIFHRFAHFSILGRVLRAQIDSPTYAASYDDPRGAEEHRFPPPAVPYLKFAAMHDERTGSLTLFALNRSLDEAMPLKVTVRGFPGFAAAEALAVHNHDLGAANTRDDPDRTKSTPLEHIAVEDDRLRATLAPPPGTSSGSLQPADQP